MSNPEKVILSNIQSISIELSNNITTEMKNLRKSHESSMQRYAVAFMSSKSESEEKYFNEYKAKCDMVDEMLKLTQYTAQSFEYSQYQTLVSKLNTEEA